ncbi:MAG: hypothetical protein FWE40_04165 [Oscillospiraceae bacterium]|nr:hypothetical protein [Oscillospiraceae bacterium]
MLPTLLFPLSRIITAVIVFFTSIFGGMGWDVALNRLPPSLEPLSYPVWIHSHWIWENVGYCETIKDWVHDMQAAGIPVAAIIIDRPWEASTHTWTQRHLPREDCRTARALQRSETGLNGERSMQRDGYNNVVDSVGSYIPCPVRYCCFFEEWYAQHNGVPNEGPGFIEYFNAMGIEVLAWGTGMVNTNSPNHWGPVRIGTEADGFTGIYQDRLEWAAEHNFPMVIPCTSYFMNEGQLVSWWGSHSNYTFRTYGSLLDYTNPAAVDWWEDQLDNVLNMGLSGWKVDGTDPYVATLLPAINHEGRLIGWRSYKYAAYRHWIDYSWENFGAVAKVRAIDDYPFRAGVPFRFAPREGNFLAWAGDQDNDWRGMRAALNNIFASSMFNYVNVGSDIGGFRGGPYDNPWDVFIRWAQLGAFSTLMEMESTLREVPREFLTPDGNTELAIYTEHRPFRFNDFYPQLLAEHDIDIVAIYRDFAIMHTNLQPYIASQVMFSYERRQPTVRPAFGYYQYMLGDEIFVAPIVQQGDYSGHYRRIIFPRGSNWIYLFDETQVFRGGSMHVLHFSYDVMPVFIREGAIIPRINLLDVPVGAPLVFCNYTTIYIYPVQGSNRFGLFEEGQRGAMINYTMTRNNLHITMDPTERDIIFRVFDFCSPRAITLDDGTALAAASSLDDLRATGLGYYVDNAGNLWIAHQDGTSGIGINVRFVSCGC